MVEKDTIFKGKVKHAGPFNFKDLYSFIYDWLNDEGYDVSEDTYSEKMSGDAKDIEIEWEASREISDYFKFVIKLRIEIYGMKKTEVMIDGKKVKMDMGLVEIKPKGILEKDYESRWEDHPFWKFLRGIYERYIIRSRIEEYEKKLYGDVEELIEQIKSYLALEGIK